jgi:hypothetical protein
VCDPRGDAAPAAVGSRACTQQDRQPEAKDRWNRDRVPGEAVQAELSRFVGSLGIDAEQTAQTYDVLVRSSPR